jgi:hypothetical protein
VTPSVVPIAVRIAITVWIIYFQVSFVNFISRFQINKTAPASGTPPQQEPWRTYMNRKDYLLAAALPRVLAFCVISCTFSGVEVN